MYVSALVYKRTYACLKILKLAYQYFSIAPQMEKSEGLGASTSTQIANKVRT